MSDLKTLQTAGLLALQIVHIPWLQEECFLRMEGEAPKFPRNAELVPRCRLEGRRLTAPDRRAGRTEARH